MRVNLRSPADPVECSKSIVPLSLARLAGERNALLAFALTTEPETITRVIFLVGDAEASESVVSGH
jgi:hypothetical protein